MKHVDQRRVRRAGAGRQLRVAARHQQPAVGNRASQWRATREPAVATISLGGAGPKPPTAVAAQTADGGLLVSWTAPAGSLSLQGYQVLCSPGPGDPRPPPSNLRRRAVRRRHRAVRVARRRPDLLRSDQRRDPFGARPRPAERQHLSGGGGVGRRRRHRQRAVGDRRGDAGTDAGVRRLYKEAGGAGLAGCAAAGGSPGEVAGRLRSSSGWHWSGILRGRGRVRPRRRRAGTWALPHSIGLGTLIACAPRPQAPARATAPEEADGAGARRSIVAGRVAPHLEPGAALRALLPGRRQRAGRPRPVARPFEQVFSSKKRLMAGLEIDRQLSHRGGTWAIAFGVGYYKATASALAVDYVTRTGDQTSLRNHSALAGRRLPRRFCCAPAWAFPSSRTRSSVSAAPSGRSTTPPAARRPRARRWAGTRPPASAWICHSSIRRGPHHGHGNRRQPDCHLLRGWLTALWTGSGRRPCCASATPPGSAA